jgi:peroxiredoxin
MKKFILILVLLLFVMMSFKIISKRSYTSFNCDINVNIKDSTIKDGNVFYLQKDLFFMGNWEIVDSCVLKNSKLTFKTHLKEPFIGIISLKNNDTLASPGFAIANKPISIKWNKAISFVKNDSTAVLIDGGEFDFIKKYNLQFDISSFNKEISFDVLNQISQFGVVDPKTPNYEYWVNYEKDFYNWVKNNSDKYFTLIRIYDLRMYLSEKTISSCLEGLKPNYSNTTIFNILSKHLKTRKTSQSNANFIDMELIDNKKENIKSKDIFLPNKNLYIVDFGASWCGYCILQARELNKKYESIDTTKIQIISISVDKNLDDWLKFEKRENYKWKSYIVNNKFDNYQIKSLFSYFPTYFVLDRNKKVIGRYYSLDEIPFLKLK